MTNTKLAPDFFSAVRPTTLIVSSKLNERLGLDLTIASETFQHTGSFKFRAAYNLAASVPHTEILTASSGNFGQALAYACRILGKKCTVVMPESSAAVKIEAVRAFGATVDLINTAKIGRNERVAELAKQMPGAYHASAYDDDFVIAGNSTLGSELAKADFDSVIAPVGGGGLVSGIILGLANSPRRPAIFGAEPLQANDAARSFREGKLIANETEPQTIADGARTISLGSRNWPIIRGGVTDFIEVPEEEIAEAVRLYYDYANLKCEPTGALSLGAILRQADRFRNRKICLIVSGGNVDASVYKNLIG